MEKVIRLFLMLLVTTNAFCQNKTIIPKNGIVVFKCIEEIQDKKLYESSKNEFLKSFLQGAISSVKKEREEKGIQMDSLKMKQLIEEPNLLGFFSMVFSKKDNKFYLEYQDSIVTKGEIVKDVEETSLIINYKTRKYDNGFAQGYYDFSKNVILDFIEDKKSKKVINGYECFKVIYSFKESSTNSQDDYDLLMSLYKTTREMWVTNKIKSEFHPVVNDKMILDKYYPLEIIETTDMFKGMNIKYVLDKFDL